MNIYLFDINKTQKNSLKDFLYYLKFNGKRGVVDFSYANETDTLHQQLSVKENLILDSVPTSLIKDNEVNLSDFLGDIKNPGLISLLGRIKNLEEKVSQLDHRTMKLASLVKALIAKRELLFLVEPNQYLNKEDLKNLKSCLEYESQQYNRKIYIQSSDQDCWLDTARTIISRNDNGHFCEKLNPFLREERRSELKLVA